MDSSSSSEDKIVSINFLIFIWYLIRFQSFKICVEKLCQKYNTYNLIIKILWKKLYILQSDKYVKTALSRNAQSQLTFVNDVFFSSHNHRFGIGNLDYSITPCLWQSVHTALTKALDFRKLEELMRNDLNIFLNTSSFSLNERLEEYVMSVWSKYSFGSTTKLQKYSTMRNLLVTTIKKTYYNQTTNYIPIIGKVLALYRYNKYKQDFIKVNKLLEELIHTNNNHDNDGFIQRFKNNLEICNNIEVESNLSRIVLDNAFLNILVFDFIYMLMLNTMIHVAKNSIDDHSARVNNKQQYLSGAFLFPFRFRKIGSDIDLFKKGDYTIVNLLETKLFFSSGPRSCIGSGFVDKFYKIFFDLVKDYKFRFIDDSEQITYSNNYNIPTITSNHMIKIIYEKDYLKHNLKSFDHKGKNFYAIESLPQNPCLYDFIIRQMCCITRDIGNVDGIVSAEARGWLFASAVANRMKLPLYVIRKKGKLPGPVHQVSYKKSYDDEEILEISQSINLMNKNIVIIDDGIASGSTTDAMDKLSRKTNANITGVIVCVKHSYTSCSYKASKVHNIFDL